MLKLKMRDAFKAASLAGVVGLLGACSGSDSLESREVNGADFLSGESILPLGTESAPLWLVTSENRGLLLLDENGSTTKGRVRGTVELLDMRKNVSFAGGKATIAVTMEQSTNQPLVVAVNKADKSLTQLAALPALPYEVDGLCMYQDSQQHTYLFTLDGHGKADQWLLAGESLQKVRTLSLPALSSYCSVDDTTDTLFVSEEDIGVWAYGAHPESEPGRKVVELVQPYGGVENVAAVAAIPGGVVLADPETGIVDVFKDGDEGYTQTLSYKAKGVVQPEAVGVNNAGRVGLYDDDSDKSFAVQIDLGITNAERKPEINVLPTVQTPPMSRFGDVADDPAIWVNGNDATQSLVLGTNKKLGLYVYDMEGNQKQELLTGRLNNVDVRYGFQYSGKSGDSSIGEPGTVDIAAASNRSDNSIALFTINPVTGFVADAGRVQTSLDEVYGICMYQPSAGEMHVFINDKDGSYQQYQLTGTEKGIGGKLVRSFQVPSQPEGCVADDRTRQLFVGEEGEGIWTIGADADAGDTLKSIATVDGVLKDDVEGLSLYVGSKKSYLVASSQGNSSYVVYDSVAPYRQLGAFKVGLNVELGIDGTSETDGLDVTSANLGGEFSQGMLVVQDGRNRLPDAPQNFKYIPWSSIEQALGLQ